MTLATLTTFIQALATIANIVEMIAHALIDRANAQDIEAARAAWKAVRDSKTKEEKANALRRFNDSFDHSRNSDSSSK
jgi:hypothetical protein